MTAKEVFNKAKKELSEKYFIVFLAGAYGRMSNRMTIDDIKKLTKMIYNLK